jgi:hypothetical protein
LYVLAILKRLDLLLDLVLEVGDPQTYLLLYCSVFKERTRAHRHLKRTSFDRIFRGGVQANPAIVSKRVTRVKRDFVLFLQRRDLHRRPPDLDYQGTIKGPQTLA